MAKLIQITNENHLNAPKPLFALRTVQAEKLLHTIEKICPDHRNLINNNGIELFVNMPFQAGYLLHLLGRYVRLETEE